MMHKAIKEAIFFIHLKIYESSFFRKIRLIHYKKGMDSNLAYTPIIPVDMQIYKSF